LVIVAVAVVVIGVVTTVLTRPGEARPVLAASTTAPGSQLQALVTASSSTDVPPASRPVTWASDGETVGAWVSLSWPRPTAVNTVRFSAAGRGGEVAKAFLLTFDDGASLLVTADGAGDAHVTFAHRVVSHVRLTVSSATEGAGRVALAALSVDDHEAREPGLPSPSRPPDVLASSGLSRGERALQDGDARLGTAGASWAASASDDAPWVRVRWPQAVEVSSVQVLGAPKADVLHGVLVFDDGSEVLVSGIAGGTATPTTIAFAPRVAKTVDLRLMPERQHSGSLVALDEIRFYGPGATPPRWPSRGTTYSVHPAVGSCATGDTAPSGSRPDALSLVCPGTGSVVNGPTTVVVAAPPGTRVRASAPVLSDGATTIATWSAVAAGTAGPDGRVTLAVDPRPWPRGPLSLVVDAPDVAPLGELSVQLLNRAGREVPSATSAPRGLTLQWEDDFAGPLSVSETGEDAAYAAGKPSATGMESFGDAPFAAPSRGVDTVGTVDGYLRLRAERTAGSAAGDEQSSRSGMISSLGLEGQGFAAQYGYFEARMTGAPGPGSWPAFWALNTQSVTPDNRTVGEADAVELYGHNPIGSCHTLHQYDESLAGGELSSKSCLADNGFSDWTRTWHTYGMRVVPGGATFFIDGAEVARLSHLGRYDEPFFFMVDLALGGGWPVDLSATGGTTDLYVDWVRVYT